METISKEYEDLKKNELIAEVDKLINELNERDKFVRLWGRACHEKGHVLKIWIDGRLTKWDYLNQSEACSTTSME